ncbi:putative sex-determining protein fem-1 protein [Botrytis fragariae]|uniref:Putative sex-determining protein fem-1 protein n=1 Tax=Botrytis fragariae TaxID=1964551 RepID=A0A8H6EFJ3_9HELO|nr:putative sex-determining protein fem-1 protein [Botrytis fragariae]KAF5870288.1 putative sex-determining protein fem-1 protein [Botrytis fragariae]
MGLRDKFQRGAHQEHSRQSPGGVKQLVESTIAFASLSTSTSTSLLGATINAANITAGVQSSRDPASATNTPIVRTKPHGTKQLDESEDLWLQACDTLKLQEPELAKLDEFTIPSSRSGDKIEKVVKVVIAAKTFIGFTLESEPHAAIAWAGVSMFLPDPTSTDEHRSSAVKLQLKKAIIQLYTKILLYEARVIAQFCGNSVTGYFRDALKLNDWTTMFKKMNELDYQCGDLIYAIDRDLNWKMVEKQQTMLAEALNESKSSQKARDYQENLQIEGNGPGVLWISADPGYGRSVLSKALIDENLVVSDQNTDVCYIFFKDISKEQRSLTKALAALLHQIFSSQKQLLVYTESSCAKNNTEIANLAHEMWDIMENIAMGPNGRNIICVLDALDEVDASERKFFLKQLQAMYRATVPDVVTHSSSSSLSDVSLKSHVTADSRTSTISTGSPNLKVKFLITSRPYYEIEDEFKSLTDIFSVIRLAGEDTKATMKEEINLVIDAEVGKLRLSLKADTRLRSRLKDIEHRTYLWLHLIMDTKCLRAKASRQSKTFERILDAELPSTIDVTYEVILNKSPDKKEATKLLHIVICAERPLALDGVNITFNVDESYDGSPSFEDIELEDPELFPKRIRDICGLFVSISDSRTAKEFLIAKDSNLAATGLKHSLHPYDSQSVLTQICVSYIYFNTFSEINTEARRFIISPRGQKHISNEDQFKFLKYASDYWMEH